MTRNHHVSGPNTPFLRMFRDGVSRLTEPSRGAVCVECDVELTWNIRPGDFGGFNSDSGFPHLYPLSGWWFQPLWKRFVNWCQLGWWFPIYGKIIQMFQPTNPLWFVRIAMENMAQSKEWVFTLRRFIFPVCSSIVTWCTIDVLWYNCSVNGIC